MAKRIINFITISILVVFALFLNACRDDFLGGCFKGSGDPAMETIELDTFIRLEIYDMMDVELVQDSAFKVEITAGENELANIKAEITPDSVLQLRNLNRCLMFSNYEKPKLKLHFAAVDTINIHGSVDLWNADTLHFDYKFSVTIYSDIADVNLNMKGRYFYFRTAKNPTTGLIVFKGNLTQAYFGVRGYLHINATDLDSDNLNIDSKTTGDIYVKPQKRLFCWIRSTGNIYGTQHPDSLNIVLDEKLGGKLIFLDHE